MKTLIDCNIACRVKVIRLNAKDELKKRLISFGIIKEAIIDVLEYSPGKRAVEIRVGKMQIALRDKEAQLIEVEKI